MSERIVHSATDTPEEIQAALASSGYAIEPEENEAPVAVEAPPPSDAQLAAGTAAGEGTTAADSETAEVTQESEAEAGYEPQAQTAAAPAKPKGRLQKRIDELVEQRRTAETKSAELERRLAALESGDAPEPPVETEQPQAAATEDPEPKPEDFENGEYDPKYLKALSQWSGREATRTEFAKRDAEHARAIQNTQAARDVKAFHARQELGREKYADYDETVRREDIPCTQACQHAILKSDVAQELLYWLGKHPDEAKRIASLSPVEGVYALGKVEATIVRQADRQQPPAPATQQPRTAASAVTAAPAPIKPLAGRAAGVGTAPPTGNMTREEYKAWKQRNGIR